MINKEAMKLEMHNKEVLKNTTNTQQSGTKNQPHKHTTRRDWRSLGMHNKEPLKNIRAYSKKVLKTTKSA